MGAILIKQFFNGHLRLACNRNNVVYLKHFNFQMDPVHIGSIAKQIARALAYMHSRVPIVIPHYQHTILVLASILQSENPPTL